MAFLRTRLTKPEQDDTSAVATPATLNVPVLATVYEIPRWSIHCYGPTMATLLCVFCMDLRTAIVALYSINLSIFITEAEKVYCTVRAGSLNQAVTLSSLKG